MPAKPGTERRRHKRYSVFLEGLVKYRGTDPFPCIIRDFCDHGMLLTVTSENDAGKIKQGAQLQIVLRDGEVWQQSDLVVDVRVVRASSMGFGVEFASRPAAVMRKLYSKIQVERRGNTGDASSEAVPGRRYGVSLACKQALDAYLDDVMMRFFRLAKETLDEASEHASNDMERAAYQETYYDLKENRDQIKQLSTAAVKRSFDACFEPAGTQRNLQARQGATDALSLVEKEEFEDWLNLSAVIARSESAHESLLSRLDQRLSSMLDTQINHASNPFAPAKISEAFQDAIQTLQLSTGAKKAIYNIFESALTPALDDLYLRIDELLLPYSINSGSPPSPAPERASSDVPTGSAPASSAHASATVDETTTAESSNGLFNTFATLIDLTTARTTNSRGKTLTASSANRQSQHQRGQTSATESRVADVLSALTRIQKERGGHTAATLDGHAIKRRLRELLSKTGQNSAPVSHQIERSVDVGDRLFSGIMNQTKFFPSVKPYIQQLHLPFIRLAMMDPNFIESEDHPARQLLDLLDHVASAAIEDGEIADVRLRDALSAVADQLAAIAPGDNTAIERIDERLSRLIEPLVKTKEINTRRVLEICEGHQSIQNANLAVNAVLQLRLSGKRVPAIVMSLLEAGWEHLLFLEALRNGTGSSSWTRAVEVIDKLLNWLSNGGALNAIDAAPVRQTIEYIDEQLAPVCYNRFKHEKVLNELTRNLIADAATNARKPVEMISVLPNAFDRRRRIADQDSPELEVYLARAQQLRVGDWLLFQTDDNKNQPLKLVWVDARQNLHVFVNRRGLKQLQLPIHKVAQHIKDGTVARIESLDLPLMERTINGMFRGTHSALFHNATHDPVTDLINRREFVKYLQRLVSRPLDGTQVFCYLEVDHFRIIANSCGPDAIDRLSLDLSAMLKDCMEAGDIITRLGDDTFGVLFMSGAAARANEMVRRFHEKINEFHFQWQAHSFAISVPAGMLVLTNGLVDGANRVLEMAGSACMKAKEQGRNGTQIYQDDEEQFRAQKNVFELAGRINRLISDKHLKLRCQMIAPVNTKPASLPHYEILLAVKDDSGGLAPPGGFITAAEQLKHMEDVDRWVINKTLSWIDHNTEQFETIDGFSINLSGQSLNSDQFLEYLFERLAGSNAPMKKLTFEITETVAIENLTHVEKFIKSVKRLGGRFSLDDFGTGFSSYSYLKSLGVDYLKIDGTFVKSLDHNDTDFAMVKSINEIGHYLGMKTIAEYVESPAILEVLTKIGVDFAQGYAIGRPLPLDELGVETESFSSSVASSSASV